MQDLHKTIKQRKTKSHKMMFLFIISLFMHMEKVICTPCLYYGHYIIFENKYTTKKTTDAIFVRKQLLQPTQKDLEGL